VSVVSFASAPPNKLLGGGGMAIDHEAINQARGDMLDSIGKDLGGYAHKGLREFNKALMGVQFGDSQPYWIACMEYQKHRGVPHWHLLMGGLGDERRMSSIGGMNDTELPELSRITRN